MPSTHDDQAPDDRKYRRIRIFSRPRPVRDYPDITLYCAAGEKNPPDIVKLLQRDGLIKGRIAEKNPITHGESSFAIILCGAAVSIIIAWLKARKGRKVEIRKGDLKISAPNAKEFDDMLASLGKHKMLAAMVKNPQVKSKKSKQ